MIPEHKYAVYYWVQMIGFTDEEWDEFKKQMSNFPKAYSYDGVDDEEKTVCFKFKVNIPKNELEIEKCYQANLRIKKDVIKTISNNISGRVYFNSKRGTLTKLN